MKNPNTAIKTKETEIYPGKCRLIKHRKNYRNVVLAIAWDEVWGCDTTHHISSETAAINFVLH